MTAPVLASLLTIYEVAQLLRTPVSTLRWWRHRQVGPPSFRVGRRVLYDRLDVEAYVAQCRRPAVTSKEPRPSANGERGS